MSQPKKSLDDKARIEAVLQRKKAELPHLYGFPWYSWARKFFESRHKLCFLTAANQASKSSSQIRKAIDWATDKHKWPELWPPDPKNGLPNTPQQFWYMYPSADLATSEFETKWQQFLPRGSAKKSQEFGWDFEYKKGSIHAIRFRSGVTIYFKLYTQKPRNLQASSVHAIFADEEMPPDFYNEVISRISGTQGYFSMVFTATDGHPLWFRTMERVGKEDEAFVGAHKQIVSLYDCVEYEDGSPGGWTLERIAEREAQCSSEAEVLRRVRGRFVRDEGLKYHQFDPSRHVKPQYGVPEGWRIYASVDVGSGRKSTLRTTKSSGAIVFVAVNPDNTRGTVFKTWRGDDLETSAGDILEQYRIMRAGLTVVQATYDYASKEFGIIASRSGESFVPADKSRDSGEQTLNSLFKHDMIDIQEVDHASRLVQELMTVPAGDKSRKIQDDLTDAFRYCIVPTFIPWDWSKIKLSTGELLDQIVVSTKPMTDTERLAQSIKERRGEFYKKEEDGDREFNEELDFWNDQYGS